MRNMKLSCAIKAAAALLLAACSAPPSAAQPESAQPEEAQARAAHDLAPHQQPAHVFPNTDDGKPIMSINVGGYFDMPFLSAIKAEESRWEAKGGGKETLRKAEFAKLSLLNSSTLLPLSTPPGYEFLSGLGFRYAAQRDKIAPSVAGEWVIEWDGRADFRLGSNQLRYATWREKNRIEIDLPARAGHTYFELVKAEEDFANLRAYRAEHEALIKKGKLLAPAFEERVKRYKIIRTLDLQSANVQWQRTADQFIPIEAVAWKPGAYADNPGEHRGFPPEPLFQMAMEADAALWMHFPGQAGASAALDEAYLAEGDKAAMIRTAAQAEALEIVESVEWDKIAARIVSALIASDYPEDRRFYLELDNEVWNYAHGFWHATNYFDGVGKGLGAHYGRKWGTRHAYGYLTARMAVAFEKALANAGREQAWVPVLAGQMANPWGTKQALEAYRAFFEDRGAEAGPWLEIAGVSTASYYFGVFKEDSGVVTPKPGESREQAWLREIESDPDSLLNRMENYIVKGPAAMSGTLAWVAAKRNEHQKYAEEAGAFFLGDYEGHDHDRPPSKIDKHPRLVNFVEEWRYGETGGRVTRAWVETLREQNPGAVISNYGAVSVGDDDDSDRDAFLEAPWDDGYYGDVNERLKAFDEYLRSPD